MNYAQHYGLSRTPDAPSRPDLSWNSNNFFTNAFTLNITRSDIQHVYVGGSTIAPASDFTMDGVLDSNVPEVSNHNGMHLYVKLKGSKLYVATNATGAGNVAAPTDGRLLFSRRSRGERNQRKYSPQQ